MSGLQLLVTLWQHAWLVLGTQRLRAFLTVLAEVIDAASVITKLAIGQTVSVAMVASNFPQQKGWARKEITQLLRQRHHIARGAETVFLVRDLNAPTDTLKPASARQAAQLQPGEALRCH